MRATVAMISLVMIVGASAFAQSTTPESTARAVIESVFGKNYKSFSAMADATVKAALPADGFANLSVTLEFQYGAFQKVRGVTESKQDAMDIFVFDLEMERADLKLMVALNAERKVGGLRIVGAEMRSVWRAPSYVDRETFVEEEVTAGAESFPVPATLSLPRSEKPVAAVVLVHGSGPHDRDETISVNKPFKDLAWGLASRGIAVLRYEKRTKVHGGKLDMQTITLNEETIADVHAAVRLLRSRKEIDPSRIFVAGHSLGGLAAPYVAEEDDELAGIISIAGSSRPILDIIPEQLEYLSNPESAEEIKREAARVRGLALKLRSGKEVGSELVLGVPLRYWQDIDRRDPAAVAAALEAPVLVIHGGRDYQVTMGCYERWQSALAGKKNASVRLFDDLNHLMIAGTDKSTPQEYQRPAHVAEKVVEAIAQWVHGQKVQ